MGASSLLTVEASIDVKCSQNPLSLDQDDHSKARQSQQIRIGGGEEAEYAALLRQCGNSKALSRLKQVHARIRRRGSDRDTFLGNIILQMYGKCSCLEDAKKVFDDIREKNVISWTLIVAAYAGNGHCREAFQLFRQMSAEGIKPDKVAFVEILSACASIGDLAEGESIHAQILGTALEFDVVLGTALVTMYGKCGNLDGAKSAFDKIHQPNNYSWNALIAAYAQNGHCRDALRVFQQMDRKPDKVTLVSILGACSTVGELAVGKAVHAQIVALGLETDSMAGTALVSMYGKCGKLDDARSVFDKMHWKDTIVWNCMIAAYAQHGHAEDALELYHKMDPEGVRPVEATFVSVLDACSTLGALSETKAIHARVVANRFVSHIIDTALVVAYGKCQSPSEAREVFNKIQCPQVASWNAMISVYAQNELSKDALQLFRQMDLKGVKQDEVTFINVLGACSNLEAMGEGKRIHGRIIGTQFESDVVLGTALIHMYGKCGCLDEARSLLDKMQGKDMIAWNAMITAYAQHGHGRAALELFERLTSSGVQLNVVTFISLLNACSSLGALAEGKAIHQRIRTAKLDLDVAVGNALMNMYGKCGSLDDARSVFESMKQRSLFSWNTMLAAYAQNTDSNEVLQLVQGMYLEGTKPNEVTFVSILYTCSHAGLVEEGQQHFVSIGSDHDLAPTAEHYGCMIDLLGRSGWLAEAEYLITIMPVQPDVVSWMTLLGACNMHTDVARARHAAERVFELDPKNVSPYILLSNVYGTVGMWDEMEKLRKEMEDKGLKKPAGWSSVQIMASKVPVK